MSKIDTTKKIVNIMVGFGTGSIVGQIVRNNTSPRNIVDATTIPVASMVAGSLAAEHTKAHSDKMIDDLVAWWKSIKTSN